MALNLRKWVVAIAVASSLSGGGAGSVFAAPAKKPAAAKPAGNEPAGAGDKKGEAVVTDLGKKADPKKKAAPKKEEKKGPAKFDANADTGMEDAEREARTDAKRDEQIDQLKRIIPKIQGPQKADLLYQLAELWWEKSKYMVRKGVRNYDAALEKWMKASNEGKSAGAEPQLATFTREGELYRQEAMRKYEEILKEYPSYERKDEVLFAYAYNKYELGQKEEAIAKYNELIKQYPTSKYVPDAYVQMGEHFFAANNLSKARTAYEKALNSNNPRIKYFALYKLAWCDFNAGAYEDAVKKFKEVIAAANSEKQKGNKEAQGLKNEALNDIVTSFAQLDAVDEAITYFKKNTGKENATRLIGKLAGQYAEAGKHDSAIRTYRQLLSDNPNDPHAPEYQNSIIASYEAMRKRDMVAKEMRRLVENYRPNSPWAKANSNNKVALEAAYEVTEGAMRTMVTEYHQEAQKTKAVETYKLARDIYKEYLDNFGSSEFAYNLRYYYADILWALNDFETAATQYLKVTETDPKGQYSKMANYNAILCYEKLVDASKGKVKIEELKDNQKIDEKKSKGKAEKTQVRLDRHDKNAKEEEIPTWEKKLVDAIDKYVTTYPGTDDEISARYKAAFIFYDHKHDIEAAKRFGEIINKWPTDQWSRKAADLTLDILNQKEEWFELNRLAREFNANKKLVTGDKAFADRIADLVEASQYKYDFETVYTAQKKPAEAAVKFREFVAEFPKSKYSPQALFAAMVIHQDASQLDLGIEDGEKLLKEYPEGKKIDQSDLIAPTILTLASFYEKTADYKTAADYYERYFEKFLGKADDKNKKGKKPAAPAAVAKKDDKKKDGDKKDEKAEGLSQDEKLQNAMFNAALWNEGLGNFAKAIALYQRYIETWPTHKDVPELFLNIALIQEKEKNWKEASKLFAQYVTQYGKDVKPGKVYFAKYREMLALRELKQDKDASAKVDELIKSYDKLSKEEKESDTALNAYAHCRFLALDPLWKDYSNIKFDNVAKLRGALKSKLETIAKVEKAYTAVLAVGAGDWGIASLTRIGMAYQDFAKNLIDSPDPVGLDEDQLAMYRGELENKAFPLEEKAIEAFEKALDKSYELSVYNDWTLKAEDQINKFKPGAFLEAHEVPYQGAEFFATAPAILDGLKEPPHPKEEPAKAAPQTVPVPGGQPVPVKGEGAGGF